MSFFFQGAAGPVVTPPVLVSATVDSSGAKLVLVFNVPVTGNVGFALTADSLPVALSAPVNAADTITFTCEQVYQGETCLLSYTAGDVQDLEGDPLGDFTDAAVTNNSTVSEPSASYLISANFNAADQSFVNGQVLDTPAEGVQVGSLTINDSNSDRFSIESNRLKRLPRATTNQSLIHSSQTYETSLGVSLLATVNLVQADLGVSVNISNTTARGSPNDGAPGIGKWVNTRKWRFSPDRAAPLFDLIEPDALDNTNYRVGAIAGGYDVSGLPYKIGDVKTDFPYGGAGFIKDQGSENWTLRYRMAGNRGIEQNYSVIGGHNSDVMYIDDIVMPDADLSNLLQLTVFDTFTGANGTLLTAHTPEVGGAWSFIAGTIQIQSNKAQGASVSNNRAVAVVDGVSADVFVEAIVETGVNYSGFALRASDDNNQWHVEVNTSLVRIVEITGGVETLRASAISTGNASDRLVAVSEDESIYAYHGNSVAIAYDLAAANKSITNHGVKFSGIGSDTVDNFGISPRGTGGEYSELDNYPGAT